MVTRRRGFTLMEVLVALVLLGVGLTGVVGLGILSLHLLRRAEAMEAMAWRARALSDSILEAWGGGPGSGRSEEEWGLLEWEVRSAGSGVKLEIRGRPAEVRDSVWVFETAGPGAGVGP